jgi:hypothetical protein
MIEFHFPIHERCTQKLEGRDSPSGLMMLMEEARERHIYQKYSANASSYARGRESSRPATPRDTGNRGRQPSPRPRPAPPRQFSDISVESMSSSDERRDRPPPRSGGRPKGSYAGNQEPQPSSRPRFVPPRGSAIIDIESMSSSDESPPPRSSGPAKGSYSGRAPRGNERR